MTTEYKKPQLLAPDSALHDIGLHDQITAIRKGTDTSQVVSAMSAAEFYAIDKLEAHINNIRHVAVSIFVFHGDRLLLQRRAKTKYHSAGLWANTVCSHPRWDETASECAGRRLNEELGWNVPLSPFGSIDYAARVGNLYENEHVHCFYGKHNEQNDIRSYNPAEVDAVEWLTIAQVRQRIKQKPVMFSEWFKIYMSEHRHMIEALV